MHEKERQRLILNAVREKPVVTVREIVDMTGASEATIRRDISTLDQEHKLRRVHGGAEAMTPPEVVGLSGRPFSVNATLNSHKKKAIARAAAALCIDGEPVIINGGTTTFQMVHFLDQHRMTILTNSFPIAEHLLKHSKNNMLLPGGTVYREQNIILSPFENDVTANFYAKRMFIGSLGIGPMGMMERDPLLIQAERKLITQADELIVLVDSSKFAHRSSLILCPLQKISKIITDDDIAEQDLKMLESSGIEVIITKITSHPNKQIGTEALIQA